MPSVLAHDLAAWIAVCHEYRDALKVYLSVTVRQTDQLDTVFLKWDMTDGAKTANS